MYSDKLSRLTLSPLYQPKPPSAAPPLTARYRLHRSPLLPAVWPPAKTMCLDKSIPCAHKTMTLLHTQTLSTTFTNNFCACQSSSFTDIRLICSGFVEFITSFFHVLTYFNGCVAAMDARRGFGTRLRWFCDRFVTMGFGENEHFAVALGSGSDVNPHDWDVRCQQ